MKEREKFSPELEGASCKAALIPFYKTPPVCLKLGGNLHKTFTQIRGNCKQAVCMVIQDILPILDLDTQFDRLCKLPNITAHPNIDQGNMGGRPAFTSVGNEPPDHVVIRLAGMHLQAVEPVFQRGCDLDRRRVGHITRYHCGGIYPDRLSVFKVRESVVEIPPYPAERTKIDGPCTPSRGEEVTAVGCRTSHVVDELAFRVAVILPLQEYEQRKDRPSRPRCCSGAPRRAGHRIQEAIRALMAGYTIRVRQASRETSRHCRDVVPRILQSIEALSETPVPFGVRKLGGGKSISTGSAWGIIEVYTPYTTRGRRSSSSTSGS